jgi:hypothetical protein
MTEDEQAERCADLDCALDILSRMTRDWDDAAAMFCPPPPRPEVQYIDALCDWEHGVCLCPGCGKVVAIKVPVRWFGAAEKPPVVVDADNRIHFCGRYFAWRLHQAGIDNGRALAEYARRPALQVVEPAPPNRPTPPTRNGHYERGSGL